MRTRGIVRTLEFAFGVSVIHADEAEGVRSFVKTFVIWTLPFPPKVRATLVAMSDNFGTNSVTLGSTMW
jgi:hypothetical protein